ncbi:MAG: hypothetical protein ABWK53_12845 [Anaerolineales bacterium]
MKRCLTSLDLLWLGPVLLTILAIAFLLPVTPQDYWWYLRLGQETLAAGAPPTTDTWTWSRAGAPVVYHSWGAAVLFWLTYRAGGLTLTVLLRGLVLALTYALTFAAARRLGGAPRSAALVTLLAVLTTSNNWSLRPQLLAYPLFALALYLLLRWQTGDRRAVWGLPPIALLWVNLHGSFVMLFLLGGAALLFGRGERRPLAFALAVSLLATLLNPRGLGAWTYVYASLTSPSSQQFSAEWHPPLNRGWQMNLFFAWLLLFAPLAALSPRKLERLEWLWCLGFGWLALSGLRYIIWFVLLLTVLTAAALGEWERRRMAASPPGRPAWSTGLMLVCLLLPLALLPGVRQRWWPDSPPVTEDTPLAAADWLRAHPDLPGPLWSEIGFSSYLEFALPERPVWMDTRFEVFPPEQWEDYRAVTQAAWDWQARLDAAGANLLMVSTASQPDLLAALEASSAWCERYRDPLAAIYQRGACP